MDVLKILSSENDCPAGAYEAFVQSFSVPFISNVPGRCIVMQTEAWCQTVERYCAIIFIDSLVRDYDLNCSFADMNISQPFKILSTNF